MTENYQESSLPQRLDTMGHRELKLSVPWGHIAAKAWGSETERPVLGIHGFMDNANTFDRLVSYLPPDVYFVAIDLPGHGHSSRRPDGALFYHTDYIMDVRRAVQSLGWTKFSIIGHSLGAGIAFIFSAAFPKMVDKMILLDTLCPIGRPASAFGHILPRAFTKLIKVEGFNKKDTKVYTKEEILQRFLEGHKWCTEESAKILAERGVAAVDTAEGTKYVFKRDPRLRMWSALYYSPDEVRSLAPLVTCEVLYIRANQGIEHDGSAPEKIMTETFEDILEVMMETCKKLEVVHVDGNHHVHLNQPGNVGHHVARILQPNVPSKL